MDTRAHHNIERSGTAFDMIVESMLRSEIPDRGRTGNDYDGFSRYKSTQNPHFGRRRMERPSTCAGAIAVDAFNALNHVNYTGYVGVVSSPLFGRPVSSSPARRVQVQLQLEF